MTDDPQNPTQPQTPVATLAPTSVDWREGVALPSVLCVPQVQAVIRQHLKEGNTTISEEQLKGLLQKIRIIDLRDYTYWAWMLGCSLIFLAGELVLVLLMMGMSGGGFNTLGPFLIATIITLFVEVGIIGYIFYSHLRTKGREGASSSTSSWPVLVLSFLTMLSNVILVATTGFNNSPFLPLLLAIATFILSLPRENSKKSITLIIIVSLMTLICLLLPGPAATEELKHLAIWMNIFSLVFTLIVAFVLRQCSAFKVETNES